MGLSFAPLLAADYLVKHADNSEQPLGTTAPHPRITCPMLNQRLPASVVLTCSIYLLAAPLFGSTNQDSLKAVLHDAVSTNQRASVNIAAAYRAMRTDPAGALEHARQAVVLADRSIEPMVEHKALQCLAHAEERMGLFPDAMKTTLKAVDLAQELGEPLLIATDLRDLSKAYRLNGMPEKAVEEARNSLAMMLPTQKEAEVAEGRLFLIQTLKEADHLDEAYQLADHCLSKAKELRDTVKQARINRVLGEVLVAQRRFPDAVIHLTQAERILGPSDLSAERFSVYDALTMALIKLQRTEEATETLRKATATLAEVDTWNNRQRIAELRYHLAVAKQNWRDAVSLLEGVKSASDSMLHARLDMQMTSMQLNYQLANKEKANAQLRTENAQSAEFIAGVQTNNRILVSALLIATILAGALLISGRHRRRMAQRLKLKNAVVKKQHDEILAKHLELQRQNLRLAEAITSEEEKEVMIKEIHHRVKNNLQVVDSLLHIQGINMADPVVGKVLREAQGRIRSMALVHDHIYRSTGGGKGDLRTHLEKLTRNILAAHGVHDRISVQVDTDLPIFPMDALLPFTLIVNELLTNALKYAFQDQRTGRVTIAVKATAMGYELRFHDDGAGMLEGKAREHSFGLELVQVLAGQLNGTIKFTHGNGTTVSMTFAPDPVPMRIAS